MYPNKILPPAARALLGLTLAKSTLFLRNFWANTVVPPPPLNLPPPAIPVDAGPPPETPPKMVKVLCEY
ncbi:MAG: hypothetical protein ACREBR_01405 [bacterium]